MSAGRLPRRDGSQKDSRSDAKLLDLPEKDRERIAGWVKSDGWPCALQRIATELHIRCGKTTLYNSLAVWGSEKRRDRTRAEALAQLKAEGADQGLTPQAFMAALDRRMAEIYAANDDHENYQGARYLIIADESARTKAELEKAKLKLRESAESRSQEALKLEREKFMASIRTKVEQGLTEIAEQIKGNKAAEAALAKLQEALAA